MPDSRVPSDDLVARIRVLAHDLHHRNDDWRCFFRNNTPENAQAMLAHAARARQEGRATGLPSPDLPTLATPAAVQSSEMAVGFRFPTLLVRLWMEVANGGFGPGGGLFGVTGGWQEERVGLTIVPFYFDSKQHNEFFGLSDQQWPDKLVPICYWGGDDYSAVDCTTAEGDIIDLLESNDWCPERKNLTFPQWMEAWVNGLPL